MINIFLACCILYIFSFAFIKIDDGISALIRFIKYKILKQPMLTTRTYKELKELLKNSWLRDKYLHAYRFFYKIVDFPEDFYYDIKYFIERGRRGWSTRDTWGFDDHLSTIIAQGVNYLRKNKTGIPNRCFDDLNDTSNKACKKAEKKWNKILDKIQWTFEIAQGISQDGLFYQPSRYYSKKKAEIYNKLKITALSKEDCKRYEEGWKLFQENFFCLYD